MAAFLACLTVAVLVALPARANMFTITDIPISATADSAVSAKSVAIAEGQAIAFQKLLQRIVAPYDVQQIPQPDATALQSVVAGFSLDNERTSATQYLADLTVRFNGDAVEYLLSQHGVRLSVEQASPVLVVPVYWTGEKAIVWDDVNPWRQIWERLDLDNRLVPALLPLGDASDALVDAEAVVRAEAPALELLRGRYGVEFVLVSVVAYDRESGRIEGALTGTGPQGPIDIRATGEAQPEKEAEAFATVARSLLDQLDITWRDAIAADPLATQSQSIALGVPFNALQEWVGIRSRLEYTPGVESVDVRALNNNSALVDVTFTGELQQLVAALEAQRLFIYDNGNGYVLQVR